MVVRANPFGYRFKKPPLSAKQVEAMTFSQATRGWANRDGHSPDHSKRKPVSLQRVEWVERDKEREGK